HLRTANWVTANCELPTESGVRRCVGDTTPARALRSAMSRLKDKVERLKKPNGSNAGIHEHADNGCGPSGPQYRQQLSDLQPDLRITEKGGFLAGKAFGPVVKDVR
ncbi:MAG TPA: hypothetical protein PKE06_16575, partial [Flavilitoribacter sp.]|nr:hypothetical protein [Flavilitoribacter sp.]HMQ91235.1 hypothetical protein [Flavilitoribacter sp.]